MATFMGTKLELAMVATALEAQGDHDLAREVDRVALLLQADPNEEFGQYNTELAKQMSKLKKDTGASTIQQNYKGTGSQAFRRQLWVRWEKLGAVIDLWLENGFIRLGGVVTRGGNGTPNPKVIKYNGRPKEQVYADVVQALKGWLPEEGKPFDLPHGNAPVAKVVSATEYGHKFKSFLDSHSDLSHHSLGADRNKVLMAIYKKWKSVGDAMIRGGKHQIMDATDGYVSYVLEDMSDGELYAFAKWKGLFK